MTNIRFVLLVCAGMALAGMSACSDSPEFDILILNGRVIDGTGNPWYYADIGITGNRITAMGTLSSASSRRVIDAQGYFVSPGFIDPHSHAARGLTRQDLSHGRPLLAQGITSIVANPDGGGPLDLVKQREDLLEHGTGVHVAQFVPHSSVRREVMNTANRPATSEELEKMKALVREGMDLGALGLSTGIFYVPAAFAETDELIALSHVVAEYGGVHQSHIRDESNYSVGVVAAVDEIIEITRVTGVTGIVSHIKALGTPVWGASGEIITNIDAARAEGLPIFADQYPYAASATSLVAALVPSRFREGGSDSLRHRLGDPELRTEILQGITENLKRRGGPDRIQYRRFSPDSRVQGRTLRDVAEEQGLPPEKVALLQIGQGNAGIVSFNMDEDDIAAFMKQPWTMTSSDGGYVEMGDGVPHPRNYGTFPRKIRKYVFEEEIVPLEFAIRSMTSLTAGVLGMHDRGLIRPGMIADIVVFDPDTIADPATYLEPHQYAVGMAYVIVGGGFAIDEGEFTSGKYGEIIRRSHGASAK